MKKILLIHGWSYMLYNSQNTTNPWQDRIEFLNLLKKVYEVDIVKLPGFCGTLEPSSDYWTTREFGLWLIDYIKSSNTKYDYLIGYSFGAPVALYVNLHSELNIPCILISPALLRDGSLKSKFAKLFSWLPIFIKNTLRNTYLNIVSPYYKYGTNFLKNSYKIVVRENTIPVLINISKKTPVTCIYGTKDTATPLDIVRNDLLKNNITYYSIENGGHNIAKTHPNQIVELINLIIDEI